jgi:protease-4
MRFIFRLLRFFWDLLDGVRKVLHLVVLLALFTLLIVAAVPQAPFIPTAAALVVAPQGNLVEQLSGGPLDRAFAAASGQKDFEVRLHDVVEAIHRAKDDKRIKALVFDLDDLSGGGIAKLEEIADAVREFRTSGKQVIAYGQSFDQQQYYLAAQADQIYLDPHGMVFIDGFANYRQFYKEAIDKLGVNINVFKAGKFKSYVDQFTRSDMSPEDREASLSWLQSVWGTYQNAVVKARGLESNALTDYANQLLAGLQSANGDFAKLALQRRLVTDLKTREEVEDQLKQLVGEDEDEHSFKQVQFEDYVNAERVSRDTRSANKIGIVVAEGEIVDGERTAGTIGGDSMVELLRKARYDDDVKAVVLRIDSPGGSVVASELIRREVAALKKAGKPVIASMSSTAASGGYYIAMDADQIWANPATITGSIGVFSIVPTFERSLSKLGVTTDGVGTTSLSGALQLDRALSEDTKRIEQLAVEHEYAQFVDHVAQARNKAFDEIDAIAQGRVWAAPEAKQHGLVDQLGLLEDAVAAAAEQAKLGKDYREDYLEVSLSWRQLLAQEVSALSGKIMHALAPDASLLRAVRAKLSPLEEELARLSRFTSKREAYYYCSCSLE